MLRIGTRGSPLALWQAHHVADLLRRHHGIESKLVRIRTAGDRLQSWSVAQISEQIGWQSGAKGVFIKELEEALLAGSIDAAVHSMKDVPTEIPDGLGIAAIMRREDSRDCLISRSGRALKYLPAGARIGTSSLRRQAQLRHFRPDLQPVDLRGNVDTRLKKLDAGEFDGVVLAMAGVNRLGVSNRITQVLDSEIMLPAVGQGALGVEIRRHDTETAKLVEVLDDMETRFCLAAEAALLRELQGGCQIPLGALARLANDELQLEAAVFSADGQDFVRRSLRAPYSEAQEAGKRLGQILLKAGADRILRLTGRATD